MADTLLHNRTSGMHARLGGGGGGEVGRVTVVR